MAEKIGFRTVRVEARTHTHIADFRNKTQNCCQFVCVELSEAELELTGEEFVAAVRNALHRTLREGKKVVLLSSNPVEVEKRWRIFALRLHSEDIEQLEIKGKLDSAA